MKDNLCMGCMRDKGDSNFCPHCGYSEDANLYPSHLAPRTVINERYIVGKVLCCNGESVTYLGFDTIANRKVKISEYFPETLVSRASDGKGVRVNSDAQIQFKAYMSDFIEIAQKLSRMKTLPCITQVYSVCYQNGTVYSISEYVDGISLKKYLSKRKSMLSWSETSDLLIPLIKTLSAVHEDGIIHRGISTENIVLSRTGVAKIDGFAISAVRASSTELSAELFPGFSAPEQYSEVSPHGPWTDVYAVCAVMYDCLTGKAPTEALLRSQYEELIPVRSRNETVPPEVSDAINEGLTISTSGRIQSIGALLIKLGSPLGPVKTVQNDDPTVTIPLQKETKVSAEDEKKSGSRRVIALSALVTLPILLVILIFTFWILFGNKEKPVSGESEYSFESEISFEYSESSVSSEESEEISEESVIMHRVDNFVGQAYEIVTSNEENNKLYTFMPPEYVFDDNYPAGAIIKQSLEVGVEFEEKAEMVFTVSKGAEGVILPPFDKKTKEEYTALLDELGVSYIIQYRWDSSYPAGYVSGIDHEVGSKYKKSDGLVEVYVNREPPVTVIE